MVLLAVAVTKVAPMAFCRKVRESEKQLNKEDTLCYLKANKVHFSTCVRVLFFLEETHQARLLQDNFNALMNKDLPLELKSTVCEELWSSWLMSLGVILHISNWHP